MKHLTLAITLILALVTMVHAQTPQMIWQREGAGDSSYYGNAILALGDQNNDGYNDWAVFAKGWGPPGQASEPKIEFFHGGNPPSTNPYMVRVAQSPQEASLWRAFTVGDVNGDGFEDWVVVVNLNDRITGRVSDLYYGGPGSHDQPNLILTTPWGSGYDAVGDFNGDGYADMLLSDEANSRATIYYGGNPMDTLPDWSRAEYLGFTYRGDLNGDGYSDFIAGNSWRYFDIYLGGEHPDTVPAYRWQIMQDVAMPVKDMNGDGYDDIVIDGSADYPGMVDVFFGGPTMDSVADAHLQFPCGDGQLWDGPWCIASAGDFNHDGYQDVVMVSENCLNSEDGILTVHLGHPGLNSRWAYYYSGGHPFYLVSPRTAAGLGDVNGDGVDDIGIGAYNDGVFGDVRGRCVVIAGDSTMRVDATDARPELPQTFQVSIYPNPFNSRTTIALDVPLGVNQVELLTYNLLGQQVKRQVIPALAGALHYHYDASDLATGIYLLRATAGTHSSMNKLVLLR